MNALTDRTAAFGFASTLNQANYPGPEAALPDALLLIAVINSWTGATQEPTCGVSMIGPGLVPATLLGTKLYSTVATPVRRLSLFIFDARSYAGYEGHVQVDFAGVNQTGCAGVVSSLTGSLQSGPNGSDALRQVTTNASDTAGNTASVALAAFLDALNGTFMCVAGNATVTFVADTTPAGYVLGTQKDYVLPAYSLGHDWLATANDTAPQMTWTGTTRWAAIAAEIVAADELMAQVLI